MLTKELGYFILSLREYWLALKDAKDTKDVQMIESLQGSNFVEFLDTIIEDYKIIIEHPKIIPNKEKFIFEGDRQEVKVPKGKPGLIHPNQIDLSNGIPTEVRPPSEYGNPELWRYWEPDSNLVVPTRSYIFLLKQPCWDGKFHIKDNFPNLGIRPCCKKLFIPEIKINLTETVLEIEVKKDGDVVKHTWTKERPD